MSKQDVLAVIGAMVVDYRFRAQMAATPGPALDRFCVRFGATLTDQERDAVKLFAGHSPGAPGRKDMHEPPAAVPGLMPGPCPWWPCMDYLVIED